MLMAGPCAGRHRTGTVCTSEHGQERRHFRYKQNNADR
ncbi:BQ5605_C008g05169 [Microbotryum silenes-dioicae]|uniref:BQ5605_C008g05169 protein n=1 Tax=Microbotryum silenes-dioicae TaxID=796604 RepID=A0A2X0PDZ8_9BASI|nr:BQ5605_C008g05169 [Microbotryum silenes-dioicae]